MSTQLFLQLPQAERLAGSRQLPLQLSVPAGHEHFPPRQACPGPHAVVQLPQKPGSLVRSTQKPPQLVSWSEPQAPRLVTHVPDSQTSPELQLAPQAPQFKESSPNWTQFPEQRVPPSPHWAQLGPPSPQLIQEPDWQT